MLSRWARELPHDELEQLESHKMCAEYMRLAGYVLSSAGPQSTDYAAFLQPGRASRPRTAQLSEQLQRDCPTL